MTVSLEADDLISGWGRTVVLNGVSLTAMPGSTLAVLAGTPGGGIEATSVWLSNE